MSGPCVDHSRDGCCRNVRILVLPYADDGPPLLLKQQRVPNVTPPILLDLRRPVAVAGRRSRPMHGASVPEAAVEVYDDPRATKNDIRAQGPAIGEANREVDPVPQTPPVKRRAERTLRPSVLPSIRPHDRAPRPWDIFPWLAGAQGQ